MGEGGLQQVGHVLLDEALVVGAAGVQHRGDLPLLHQVEHVGQDGGVHGEACRTHTDTQPLLKELTLFICISRSYPNVLLR